MKLFHSILPFFIFSFLTFSALADDSVMIVIDASGSMWGEVDGKPKINIARESLKAMVKTWPDGREVGLVAYGHRDKGDCNDIETLIEPGPLNRIAIEKAVDGLTPRGMTPLSAAVKIAAEKLKYTEKKATVILISDGVETCKLNPCQIGTELEKLGVDFTAHVIGFDVTKIEDQTGLKCLAENTGGKFISAANSEELNKAIEAVKVVTPIPTVVPTETPSPTATATPTETPQPKGKIIAALTGVKGTKYEVKAEGDLELRGFIKLYAKGRDKEIAYAAVVPADDGSGYRAASMQLPFNTGDYELRWISQTNRKIAEAELKIVEANVQIEAPQKVTIGTEFPIKISGPDGLVGYIYLYASGRLQSQIYSAVRPRDDAPGYEESKMRATGGPGKYVIKFKTNNDEVMAEQEVEFAKAEVSITGPDEVPLATKATFEVVAPDGIDGYLYLYAAGKKQYISYKGVREKATGGYEPVEIMLPAFAGDYEVKWLTGGEDLLATKTVKVVKAEFSIVAEPSVAPKGEIDLTVSGPDGFQGYVYLYAKGKKEYISYKGVRESPIKGYEPITITAPEVSGTYELRLENDARDVLAKVDIVVQ